MPTRPATHTARRLRQAMTGPERAAWQTLRQLRRRGFPVRRQVPLLGYTVDFAIYRARLIIEIDGPEHAVGEAPLRDRARDGELGRAGWRVLRVDVETARSADALLAAVGRYLEA